MDKRSLKLNILGRNFPVVIDAEEEELTRTAAQIIHDRMKSYKAEYAIQDNFDIAIMCCLEITTEYLKFRADSKEKAAQAFREAKLLEQTLDLPFSSDQ